MKQNSKFKVGESLVDGMSCYELVLVTSNGSPKTSQVLQDDVKMAPRWLPKRYVLASWSIFRDLLPDPRCLKGDLGKRI